MTPNVETNSLRDACKIRVIWASLDLMLKFFGCWIFPKSKPHNDSEKQETAAVTGCHFKREDIPRNPSLCLCTVIRGKTGAI